MNNCVEDHALLLEPTILRQNIIINYKVKTTTIATAKFPN